MCQNTTMRLCGVWNKYIKFYVQNHIAPLAMCYNPPLVHHKLPEVHESVTLVCCNIQPRGFETSWDLATRHVTAYTPFTQGLRPLCLPCATTKLSRSPLKAEGRQNGCLGRSRVVHRTFRHRHGRHGRREVLSMFKTVAQRSPRRSVAHRSLKGGRMKAHTSPWSQNGCTVVGHWSPS